MRVNVIGITFALALTAGAANVATAQGGGRPERYHVAQDSAFRRGPGGGRDAMLLRGITLSKDQQERLAALRVDERSKMGADRARGARGGAVRGGAVRGGGDAAAVRPPRARRDTTAMTARRAQMEKMRAQHLTALRSILSAEQQAQLDRNIAEMKTQRAEHGRAGARGEVGGRRPPMERMERMQGDRHPRPGTD